MGIFDIQTKTESELAKEQVLAFKRQGVDSLNNLKYNMTILFNMTWFPKDGVSVQKIWDEIGNDAADAINKSRATQLFIKSLDPSYEFLIPPYEYVVNQNGTLTVGNLIPESESV